MSTSSRGFDVDTLYFGPQAAVHGVFSRILPRPRRPSNAVIENEIIRGRIFFTSVVRVCADILQVYPRNFVPVTERRTITNAFYIMMNNERDC